MSEWADWWEATERKVLLIQSCEECGNLQHYPRALCLHCGAGRLTWIEASGDARLYSFTVSHRSPDPKRFTPPYVVALVDLAEGPRLLTRVVTDEPKSLRCDQHVTLRWIPFEDGRHLPAFEPLDKEKAK